jgi:hypothetical protein
LHNAVRIRKTLTNLFYHAFFCRFHDHLLLVLFRLLRHGIANQVPKAYN